MHSKLNDSRGQHRLAAILTIASVFVLGGISPGANATQLAERAGRLTGLPQGQATADLEAEGDPASVPDGSRDSTLGPGWQERQDVAWTLAGDSHGLHVLVSRINDGYTWRQVASLGSVGVETDRWIGNACLTADEDWLAVVYGPRAITNNEAAFDSGARAALVNTMTGEVTHLDGGFSLAYFNPGCGHADEVVLSAFSADGRTTLTHLRSKDPASAETHEVDARLTSAIPIEGGVVGAVGGSVMRISEGGKLAPVVETSGLVFEVTATGAGGIAYIEHDGTRASAMTLENPTAGLEAAPIRLAAGALQDVGLVRDSSGEVYITGEPDEIAKSLPESISILEDVSTRGTISSGGLLFIESTFAPSVPADASASDLGRQGAFRIEAQVVESKVQVGFEVRSDTFAHSVSDALELDSSKDTTTEGVSHGLSGVAPSQINTSAMIPTSTGATCAVPRNDPTIQAYQPRPAEVEWAVNRGVRQSLDTNFPLPALVGGGRVPAQVMLGILAQESNFWQASRYTVPGVTGNPLIGNYYGADRYSSNSWAWWQIDFANADCGYGIAQVTDDMRVGEMSYGLQLAIATDYRANISRGLQILIEKWNQTRSAGLTINNGDPKYIENWFYALWAYNTGFYPEGASGQPWGVGWLNNPVNQIYPANRAPFLDGSPSDAAIPQLWPYPEKVLGFAAHSAQFLDSVDQGPLGDSFNYVTAFSPSWWTSSDGQGGVVNRQDVKPPLGLFCDTSNECDVSDVQSPCTRSDYKCWFHEPATWKADCAGECGYENLSYSLTDPKPSAASSYPPVCSGVGLPSGALIVDNVPSGTPSVRSGCGTPVPSAGSFQFSFAGTSANNYPSKIDMHQLGSGFNGQFYFTHTRNVGSPNAFSGALDVTGTWTLNQSIDGWAKVYVHMPSHGAWLQQANYVVNTGLGTTTRSINQRNYANEWVELGALEFDGVPSVSLANNSATYDAHLSASLRDALSGVDDVAWDAVAFVPLDSKPSEFVVALGDSFSSGEGTSSQDGSGFWRGSDHHGTPISDGNGGSTDSPHRNACHRSDEAWPFQIDLPGIPGAATIGELVDAQDKRLDFHLLACSGAITANILHPSSPDARGQWAEQTQIGRGFLNDDTTLVTLTVGGNDVGFGPIIKDCLLYSFATLASPESAYCDELPAPEGQSSTYGQWVQGNLDSLGDSLEEVLQDVHASAPNARVVMLGYPTLFETGSGCVSIDPVNMTWLNGIAVQLNSVLTAAASSAGSHVTYQSPQYLFEGRNLCTDPTAVNSLVFAQTPGESPIFSFPVPGPNFNANVSQQSVHPNVLGADLYGSVADVAIRASRVQLSSTLIGGASTTYYSTFRLHDGGPASLNVSSFSSCGQEIRFGMRKNDASQSGVFGQQHTDTLSWTSPHAMQTFKWTAGTSPSPNLPAGFYALNARLTTVCSGGGGQPWQASLYW